MYRIKKKRKRENTINVRETNRYMQFVSASDKSKAFIHEETLVPSSITRDKKTITSRAIHGKSVVPEEKINNVFQFVMHGPGMFLVSH